MKRLTGAVVAISLVFLLVSAKAEAQEFQACDVTGKTYVTFFITPMWELGVISSSMTFGQGGLLLMSGFTGAGFYFGAGDFFAGGYYAIKAKLGGREYDIVFALTGYAFDPFIIGAGVALVDYSVPLVVGFAGFGM